MVYMLTFTINIPPRLPYIPYMDPMGYDRNITSTTVVLFPQRSFPGYVGYDSLG